MTTANAETGPDQRRILRLYAAFGAALVLSVLPYMLAAFLSLVLGLGVLIAAYILRKDTAEGSLMENHMTFVIRTIWIGSFLALLTTSAGSIYLFQSLDNTPLLPCIENLIGMLSAITPDTSVEALQELMSQEIIYACVENYMKANLRVFIGAGVLVAGPVLLYFIIRYARGLSRAMGGYRVAHPRHWF